MKSLWLMYHDVYPSGAPAADIPPGARLYHVSKPAFRRQLALIAGTGHPVLTVSEHLCGAAGDRDHFVLTFDDGWANSLTDGVECLQDAGMRATFFITRDHVGTRHYATPAMLGDALDAGMDLGTHGCAHRALVGRPESEVRYELGASKAFLEDLTGAPVLTGSVPEGDWSPLVRDVARACGYEAMCTSRPGLNSPHTDRFRLRRVAVRDSTGPRTFERFGRFFVAPEVLRAGALELPKRVLGIERYMRLRRRLLGAPDALVEPTSGRVQD